ncbi:hypothetical protein [Thiohalorhabdus sp.]|uniref:hypothetical protein n=1 Tax=Thiohalorhabdus sp. TaxID=3094134 RepID=UPI002FC30169
MGHDEHPDAKTIGPQAHALAHAAVIMERAGLCREASELYERAADRFQAVNMENEEDGARSLAAKCCQQTERTPFEVLADELERAEQRVEDAEYAIRHAPASWSEPAIKEYAKKWHTPDTEGAINQATNQAGISGADLEPAVHESEELTERLRELQEAIEDED